MEAVILFEGRGEAVFVLLFLLWIIFAGSFSLAQCVMGAVVAALVSLFCWKFMGYTFWGIGTLLRKAAQALAYFVYLMKEIIVANLHVLRFVYARRAPEPRMVRFHTDLRTDGGRVILANSITLTSGTITVDIQGDMLEVHGLDRSMMEGIEDCGFQRRAHRLED